MQLITIRVNSYEYQILQGYSDYWLKWVYAHFSFQRNSSIPAEPIVAQMFKKYFSRQVDTIRFPNSGKAFSFEYHEVIALLKVTCTCDDLPTISLRAKIDKELVDWKPSLSKPTMKDWYNSNQATAVKDTFGDIELLGEGEYEIFNRIFNQENL